MSNQSSSDVKMPFSIKHGIDGELYAAFRDCVEADDYEHLFKNKRRYCAGGFDNAFRVSRQEAFCLTLEEPTHD